MRERNRGRRSPPPPPPPLPPRPLQVLPPPRQPVAPDEVPALPDNDMFDSLPALVIPPPPPPLSVPALPVVPESTAASFPIEDDWFDKYKVDHGDSDDGDEFSYDSTRDFPMSPQGVDYQFCSRNPNLDRYAAETSASSFLPCLDLDDYFRPGQLPDFPGVVYSGGGIDVPMSPSAKLVGAGVENLGSTCFMGSILQCLTHTIKLFQGLHSYDHDCLDEAGEFCVFCALRAHMDACFTPARSVVYPTFLAVHLDLFSDGFHRGKQEDAQDFMNCALNKLQGCFPEGYPNLVEEIFGGRYVSKLRCSNCGRCSDTFESIIDLSLGIENINTFQDALDSYFKVEKIDGKVTCTSCNEDVSMEKQIQLTKTPSVAAFHLKRFRGDGNSVNKIGNHVFFPLELDLQPYTLSAGNDNVELKYDLYAVVVHIGDSPNGGHYFCFVRSSPDKWHKLDDSKVTSVSGDEVLSQQAYILFYARQGTPWLSSIMEDINSSYPQLGSGNQGDWGGDEQIEDQHSDPDSVLGNKGDSGEETVGDPMDVNDECVSDLHVGQSGEKSDTTHNQVPPD